MKLTSTRRNQHGASLVESLVVAGSLSFIAVMTLLPFYHCIGTHAKVSSHMEANDGIQLTLERLANDLHTAISLGDVYGDNVPSTTDQEESEDSLTTNSAGFPSTNDPLYSSSQPPPGGWPLDVPTNGPAPYLWSPNNTTLVVQVPIVDNNGFTTNLPPTLATQADTTQPNVETHVYTTVADENNPGQFKLQLSKFPGAPVPGYNPADHTGTFTLTTGIVGPLDAYGQPKTFQYVDKTDPSGNAQDSVDPRKLSNYNVVIVNLEVKKTTSAKATTSVGFKTELYLHNTGI